MRSMRFFRCALLVYTLNLGVVAIAAADDQVVTEAASRDKEPGGVIGFGPRVLDAEYHQGLARYHAELERCYRIGATHPWEALPPLQRNPTL